MQLCMQPYCHLPWEQKASCFFSHPSALHAIHFPFSRLATTPAALWGTLGSLPGAFLKSHRRDLPKVALLAGKAEHVYTESTWREGAEHLPHTSAASYQNCCMHEWGFSRAFLLLWQPDQGVRCPHQTTAADELGLYRFIDAYRNQSSELGLAWLVLPGL